MDSNSLPIANRRRDLWDRLCSQLGGEAPLEKKIQDTVKDFYGRVFDDLMIGFFFMGRDRRRLEEKEAELFCQILGKGMVYSGRPMGKTHAPLKIFGGHFNRRLQILRECLADQKFPEEGTQAILEHSQELRALVMGERLDEPCGGK